MRIAHRHRSCRLLLLLGVALAATACELVVSIDRSAIPSRTAEGDGGSGGTRDEGGAGGEAVTGAGGR